MKHLIPHFIAERYAENQFSGTFRAVVLFVDLSGFTPLTETLMGRGHEGAEALSRILNEIFHPLVERVYARGGFIPYFAGDAFTAIFPDDNPDMVKAALGSALAARDYFRTRSFQFGDFEIGLKIGLSEGMIEWGIVGRRRRAFFFRGTPIDRSALNQSKAKGMGYSIVLDQALYESLPEGLAEVRPIDEEAFFLENASVPSLTPAQPALDRKFDPTLAVDFLPDALFHNNLEGEFRTVLSIFISFRGLQSYRELNQFAGIVLEQAHNFQGYFKEIEFGDKGGVMVIFFGAPRSFENNQDRALEFVSTIQQETEALQKRFKLQLRMGLTLGTAFTGIVGGEERCQYAAVGNRVNLSARLMSYAQWGEILVDQEIYKNKHFRFIHRGDIKYKGIQGNIPTYKLVGRNEDQRIVYRGVMVGREQVMRQIIDFAGPLFEYRSAGLAFIFGEAGIGKSRLTYELQKALVSTDRLQWQICQADQILRKPFNPFIYFLKNYFHQSPETSSESNLEQFESRFQQLETRLLDLKDQKAKQLHTELVRTKSVLAAQVGIVFFDSLWEQLDAKGRYQNIILAITNLILSEAICKPMVLEMEDAHWLDENSQELLQELLRQLNRYPLMLLITSRFMDDGRHPKFFDPSFARSLKIPFLEVDLDSLSKEATQAFAEFQLGSPISSDLLNLLVRATNGNPFYLEQLLEYFQEQKLLIKQDNAWTLEDENISLSSSINSILMARIDLLSNLVKETVKAAAVIGREFELPVLSEVMKSNDEFIQANGRSEELLEEQIDQAERSQIWRAMSELRYIFRHSLLREAVYGMQLRTRLEHLHFLIAQAIEKLYANRLMERYADLAFHYEQANANEKACEYLRKAADYAKNNYQNQQALDYYERLLKLFHAPRDEQRKIQTHLKKGRVLELIGQWDKALKSFESALEMAKQTRDALLLGQTNNHLGRVLMLKGEYLDASRFLQQALHLFETLDDQKGISSALGNLGNLFFRQGSYQEAKDHFLRSIEISRKEKDIIIDAQIVANLGLTYMNQGHYDEGIRAQRSELSRYQETKDKQGMATIYTFLGIVYLEKGDYDEALKSFQAGLDLSQELGNKQLHSIATGNIGIVYERKGHFDLAMQHYVHDLELVEELGDKQGTAIALGLIGQLLNIQGEQHKAIEYLQKALMISKDLGYQKGIAKAVNTLGDIFFFLGQYERSLEFYDQAIEVTRKIGNRLVLGFSLAEKGLVLLETEQPKALRAIVEEALSVAEELGNPDLLFQAKLLSAKEQMKLGEQEKAKIIIHDLLDEELSLDQEADALYTLFQLDPKREDLRKKTLDLFQRLYEATPHFTYQLRIESLQSPSSKN